MNESANGREHVGYELSRTPTELATLLLGRCESDNVANSHERRAVP